MRATQLQIKYKSTRQVSRNRILEDRPQTQARCLQLNIATLQSLNTSAVHPTHPPLENAKQQRGLAAAVGPHHHSAGTHRNIQVDIGEDFLVAAVRA